MRNINDLYDDIADEKNIDTITILKKLGLNLKTKFIEYDKNIIAALAFLEHSTSDVFNLFYEDLKKDKNELEEFYCLVFKDGLGSKKGYEKGEKLTLNKALFYTMNAWNIDTFLQLKKDALEMLDNKYLTLGFLKKEDVENCILYVDHFFEYKNFRYTSKKENESRYLEFLNKFHEIFTIEKEKIYTPDHNKKVIIWDLLYYTREPGDIAEILQWVDKEFNLKKNIIHDWNMLNFPNEILELVISDWDINLKFLKPYSEIFDSYLDFENKSIDTLKDFMEIYINPGKNKYLRASEADFFRPEEKERVKMTKERAIMFQKILINQSLGKESFPVNNETDYKKRL